jgi:secreted PhoX family phosphatase
MAGFRRRQFLGSGLAGAAALALGPAFWREALAATARASASAYGPLGPPDAHGLRLPPGFTAREIARANRLVPGTAYPWHIFPDGQATFPVRGGGWVLVSNSESLAPSGAGSSAIRFRKNGSIAAAYRILAGTNANCAGGGTPWGTWLSCEEHDYGAVWECDPSKAGQGRVRPALGTFNHEAAAVDPVARRIYMTEDRPDGGLYRFTPDDYPDLTSGLLEVAVDAPGGTLAWARVPDPGALVTPTRSQVAGMRAFDGGEGIWFDSGIVYFSTKGDNRIWSYDTVTGALGTIYDKAAAGPGAPLSGVDNLTVSRAGEVFVCEDGGDMEICVIAPDGTVAPFLQLTGEAAVGLPERGNELAGVVFDPSGGRMYFSAQRAFGFGVVYEVSGPFAGAGSPAPAVSGSPAASAPAGPAAVRVRVRRRIAVDALRGRGLAVELDLRGVESVAAALRTDDLARVPGKRGSTARPKTVTLARSSAKGGRDVRLRLRIGARDAARLRARRAVTARLTVVAHRADGGTTVLERRLKIVRGARRGR